ncbi:MAG TPA: YfhO family protein, partial [Mobilitalea sp.]|nr:YfhO family protein [Mobilitalea sp.]
RKDFKSTIQGLLLTGLRTGGYYLLGVAMAAFIFLPVIYAFLQNGRMNNKPKLVTGYFLYSSKYYLSLIKGMFASGISPSYWVLLTFSSVTLVSLVILFCNKKYRQLRYVLLLAFIGLLVPSFGYFMNGFAYLANRWCFLLSFLVAMAFTMTYEKLFELNGQERIILIFAVAAYGLVTLIGTKQSATRIEFYILLAVTIIIEILQLRWFNSKRLLSELIICVMVFATVGFHGYAYYSKSYHGYVSEFLTKAQIDESTTKGEFSVVSDIKDPSFYRIETHGKSALNESMVIGFNDVSAYFSLMTGDVTNFFKELELLKQVSAYRFDGMDNRTVLDEIQSVKYYITTNQKSVPYGYKLMKTVNAGTSSYYLYQNLFALPLGYTYENYMLLSDFNKLSSLEMQNALMNAVVINSDSNYANKTNQDMSAGIQKLDVKITPDQNVVMGPGSIDIKKAGATITLTFNAVPNSETYIRLGNFNMNEKKVASTTFTATGNNGAKKNVNVRSVYYNSYFGKVNYLVNMGYTDTGLTTVTLTFPGKDTYSYSSIEVYSQAMNNYDTQAAALGKSVLDNVKIGNNNVQGDITLNNKGIMALSIPYSKGWKAYVDGKKADLLNANVMYMALPLDAGQHHIVLKYVTPLLIPGSLISLAAFGYFIWMLIFNRRVKRD